MSTASQATVLPPEPAVPDVIHSCPNCSHWLPDGTLACPDCQTLTYGQHLSGLAVQAQSLEQQQKWAEARDRWRSALQWIPAGTRQAASVEEHIAAIDARLQAVQDQQARWKKKLGPFAPVVLFLLKFKTWIFLVFKLKFLISGLLYFGLYAALFGWPFALALTTTVFIHEMGHYVRVKRLGLRVDLPMFLPGVGAYVRWYDLGVSRRDLASIALAGPVAGLMTAAACYGIYRGMHQPFHSFFLMMAYLGAYINLVNLFPVRIPFFALDGFQAAYDLSTVQRLMVAGTCLLFFGLTVYGAGGDFSSQNVYWIFLILGVGMLWRSRNKDTPEIPNSHTFAYFQALIILLGSLTLIAQLRPV